MRIISLNANGLRAAIRKGFYAWLAEQDADIVCIQELRALPEQLEGFEPPPARHLHVGVPGDGP